MPERPRSYLVVPAGGAGAGMGHLARCLRLGRVLRGRVTFLTGRMDSAARALMAQEVARFPTRPRVVGRLPAGARYDLVIVDTWRTTRGELDALSLRGLVVCLDEGGEAAAFAPFLVDTIPGLPGVREANRASPAYLDLPRRSRTTVRKPLRSVLVSFGGEDRDGLSDAALSAILRLFPAEATTVVEGPLFGIRAWPPGVRVLRDVSPLARTIAAHDLLVTHFGITAFEALACGVPVALLNPTRYHERLGRAAGFTSLGTRSPNVRRLRRVLSDPAGLAAQVDEFNERIAPGRGRCLAALVAGLSLRGTEACPVCGRRGNRVISRFPDRTYRRCERCNTIGLESFAPRAKRYGKDYFFSEYKAQYGRTYLEDFPSIKEACRPRVALIRGLLGPDVRGTVVDVGCAYGPFLAALKDAGLPGYGLDVSRDAVAWVRGKLGVPAVCASFEEVGRASLPRPVAAVTMWYVIEHFTDTALVLRKAASLLPRGGVLAFSTPNGNGLSARRSLARFLRNSPEDHFTIFSPVGLGRLLAAYGLELRRVRVTGHHPERFPGLLGRSAARFKAVGGLLLLASRLLGLGDTFEAYAVKEEM
jgi:2-polyprenyl-3-methyl-5-hydroxy-6-metoxy-1,4-benzoquinol methylase